MLRNVLFGLVVAGAVGFLVGSVIDNEMVYTLSGFVAVCTGLVMAIRKSRAEQKKGG